MRNILIVTFAIAVFLSFAEKSLAIDAGSETVDVESKRFDIESGLLFGTMRFDGGRPENTGRKFSIGMKTDLIWEGRLEKILGFRINTIAEPTDSTVQMLDDVFAVSGKLRYKLNPDGKIIFSPFLGIEAQQWKRNSSGELWGDLLFAEAVFGLGLEHDNLYFEAGGLLPFWTYVDEGPTQDGELGFMLSTGVIHKEKLKLGLFYRQEKFEGDPDSKLSWFGLSAVYRF